MHMLRTSREVAIVAISPSLRGAKKRLGCFITEATQTMCLVNTSRSKKATLPDGM
jgi:hypothetical protein